ncbi:MAG: C-terminal target protein [Bacteroidetes bacterium]|nr:C-terminal target protein [Bacteroidota bacterium]
MRKTLQLTVFFLAFKAAAQINLYSDLKLCMPCDGNALDYSGNSNHGAVSGATLTSDRFGNPNRAYQFNGTSNFISAGSFTNYAPTNELTISMWAKSDITTSNCLFIIDPDNMNDRCVGCAQYSHPSGTMMIWDYGDIQGGGRVIVTGIPADVNSWRLYVYIISESGNFKQMYKDGQLVSNTPYTGNNIFNKNKPFYIGGGTSSGGGGSIRWRGKIDDVIIYNRALNNSEIQAIYNGAEICRPTGLNESTGVTKGSFYVSDHKIMFTADQNNITDLKLYSVEGKLLKSFSEGDNQIPEINSGLYLITYFSEGKSVSQKIIIGN